MFSLEGKVAVITGAASGIGKAAAMRFSKAGAHVVAADIEDASEVAEVTGGIFVRTDVSRESDVENLMEVAARRFGRITTVINNAGIGGEAVLVEGIGQEALDRCLSVNLKGVIWGIKHAVPHMREGGSIINTSSYAGLYGTPSYGMYVATKAAVIGITRTAALELAQRGIRVNCVCPGTCETPMMEKEEARIELALTSYLYPLGRACKPEEVAALYHYLASDEAAFITGQAISIDGGMSAGPSLNVIIPLYEKITSETLDIEDFK